MNKYLQLYLFWLVWVSVVSSITAIFLSVVSSLLLYISKGFQSLNEKVLMALYDVAVFSFPIAFSLSFILSLLLVFKALFKHEFKSFEVELYNCSYEVLEQPLVSDVMQLWRKWLFLTFWFIVIFLVIVLGIYKLIFDELPLAYLNGITIYLMVVSLGGAVFVLGLMRCKKIGIKDV